MENIAMPDSLLSRFDLLFVIIDQSEPELDREIADRVIRNHRYMRKFSKVNVYVIIVIFDIYRIYQKSLLLHTVRGIKCMEDL